MLFYNGPFVISNSCQSLYDDAIDSTTVPCKFTHIPPPTVPPPAFKLPPYEPPPFQPPPGIPFVGQQQQQQQQQPLNPNFYQAHSMGHPTYYAQPLHSVYSPQPTNSSYYYQ